MTIATRSPGRAFREFQPGSWRTRNPAAIPSRLCPRHESRQCDKLSAPTPPGKFDALSCLMLKTPTQDPGGHKSVRCSPARTLPPQPKFSGPTCVHPQPWQSRASSCLLAPHHRRRQPHVRLCQDTRRGSLPAPEGDPTPQDIPRAARAPTRYSHCAPSASLRGVRPTTLTETTQRSAAPLPYPGSGARQGTRGQCCALTARQEERSPTPRPHHPDRGPAAVLPGLPCLALTAPRAAPGLRDRDHSSASSGTDPDTPALRSFPPP